MNATEARALIKNNDREDTIEAAKEWANCQEATVGIDGDIWISTPQRGHWLSDCKLVEFAKWVKNQ